MTIVGKRVLKLVALLCAATLLSSFAPRALAHDDDDPPSRVARLAYTQGSVSFQPAGTDDWVTAGLNRPVTTGDKIWSDNDSRLELQLDGSLLRLSSNTGLSFLNLSDHVTQIQLSSGTLLVRVRRLDESETYEIDTPNLAFSVLRSGLYRIIVNEAGDSTAIRISSGQGEVTGGGAAYSVHANDFITFSGIDQLSADSEGNGYREDQFDSWSANRDRRYENSNSSRYVSADVVGYEDLDDHGSWRRTPENGYVWFPRTTQANWAPYHNGHWDYIEPWGYTWVDDEPWGFAPFHYGRWVNYRGSWGWVPAAPRVQGVVYVRPVYAPALVAWVGGPHFAIGVAVGGHESYGSGVNVGWFPLGPREVYVPSYRVSRNYVNNVNVSNTTVNTTVVNNYYNTTIVNNNVSVTNVKYVNQRVPGAVAATTPRAFTSAQPVSRNAVRVDQREVASAPVRAFTPQAVPAKQAVLGTGAAAAKPPVAVETRAVVAKVAPPPPPPTFERRQEAIRNNGGKPLSVVQVKQIQPAPVPTAAVVKVAPPAAPKPVADAPRPGRGRPQNGQPQNGQPQNGQPPQANRPAPVTNTPQTVAPNATRPPDRPADRPVTPEAAKPTDTKPAAPPTNTAQPPNFNRIDAPTDRRHPIRQSQLNLRQQRQTRLNRRAVHRIDVLTGRLHPEAAKPAESKPVEPAPVTPNTAQPANRPTDRPADRPAPPNTAQPTNRQPDRPTDRPVERTSNPNNASQPAPDNRPATPPVAHPNEAPPPPQPVVSPTANSKLDTKQQQQQEQLRAKQLQQRQAIQQQQEQQHAKVAQQQADAAKKQQVEQQHQQQTQQLLQKQAQAQKALQDKQQQERQEKGKAKKRESSSPYQSIELLAIRRRGNCFSTDIPFDPQEFLNQVAKRVEGSVSRIPRSTASLQQYDFAFVFFLVGFRSYGEPPTRRQRCRLPTP